MSKLKRVVRNLAQKMFMKERGAVVYNVTNLWCCWTFLLSLFLLEEFLRVFTERFSHRNQMKYDSVAFINRFKIGNSGMELLALLKILIEKRSSQLNSYLNVADWEHASKATQITLKFRGAGTFQIMTGLFCLTWLNGKK